MWGPQTCCGWVCSRKMAQWGPESPHPLRGPMERGGWDADISLSWVRVLASTHSIYSCDKRRFKTHLPGLL